MAATRTPELHSNVMTNGHPVQSHELRNGNHATDGSRQRRDGQYKHAAVVHSRPRPSCLSHDAPVAPSFLGFRNLMVIVLVVSNLRLMVENYMKYGFLICIRCHDYRRQDFVLGSLLYLLIPCHLFVAHLIELTAATQALDSIGRRKKDTPEDAAGGRAFGPGSKWTWRLISLAHTVNSTLCLGVTTTIVYANIHHPFIGTVCELHAVIVWLKICSYALSNRDMRRALLGSADDVKPPPMYSSCPYPRNITLGNLSYFWWAPTLVYQPVYPRSPSFRLGFFLKRVTEALVLGMFIWIASAQYAAPALRNSLDKMQTLQWTSMAERLMKLSTISLVIWLAGFFATFQSALNALAELIRFGDRSFYDDWWNSPSVGAYWRMWNKPVYYFMKRHVFMPLLARGWHPTVASAAVFFLSAVLHELLVGVPTHNIIGVAFAGMILQLPLVWATRSLEQMKSINGRIIGNAIFWISFCLVGQPLAALLYFFAWQVKYGSVSKQGVS